MRLLILLMMIVPFIAVAGFDGAGDGGGQQAGGAPMADKDSGMGWQEGKPSSVSNATSKGSGKQDGQKGNKQQKGKK